MKSGREEENDSSAQASASVSRSFSNSRSSAYETESPSASTSGMVYDGGQSLASILNNPSLGKSGVYSLESGWWALNSTEPPPIVVSRTFPEISKADFQKYLDSVSECYSRFEDVRQHSTREKSSLGGGKEQQQGDALLACLREIPSLYFMENFALEDGNTFQAACPFNSDMPENNTLLQEKLSHYLDIVEVQLVKEISLRSDSFFEAQGQLQDLNGKLVAAFAKLRELKDTVKLLDADLVQNARQIQTLSRTRAGLVSLHEKLKLISYVYQSLSALKLLISAADCASALDVIDDLQQVQENNDLVGLHCFRHLSNQLASSLEAVNNILAADFVRVAIHDAKNLESTIIATFRVGEKDIVSIAEEDILMKIKSVDDPSSGLRDRLLPLVIGLLRTAKLPAVLRVYRDTLIADIKASIKTTVAELLPLLLMQASECEVPLADRQADRDGGGSSMASKLRSLSAQSFVWLLTAIFRVVQMHLIHAAEIKKVIEWIMGDLMDIMLLML